jgi:L-ribulose-5-phosphate 3-epimerase
MMQCGNWPIGVCSWSLQKDVPGVVEAMRQLGIENVSLAVRPAVEDESGAVLKSMQQQRDWNIYSTMIDFPQEDYSTLDTIKVTGGIAPDDCWERNRQLFLGAVDVTVALGVKYLTMHAGFIDHTNEAYVNNFYGRIRTLADAAGNKQITILLETGQETAEELREFLETLNHPAVAVNFDPANMILYGKGEPKEAVKVLAKWIKHIHVKDALPTETPGTWGAEVPWGEGKVESDKFLTILREVGFDGVLGIEREAGDDRVGDIKLAAERLSQFK